MPGAALDTPLDVILSSYINHTLNPGHLDQLVSLWPRQILDSSNVLLWHWSR